MALTAEILYKSNKPFDVTYDQIQESRMHGVGAAVAKTIERDGIRLSESVHSPDSSLAKHEHKEAGICIVLSGDFEESTRCQSSRHRSGDVIFRPAALEHSNAFGRRGARCLNIALDASMTSALTLPVRRETIELAPRRHFVRLGRTYRAGASSLLLTGLLYQALASSFSERPARRSGNWLAVVRETIDMNFGQQLAVDRLAAVAGVHPVHLSRAFRQKYGNTIQQYLREVRIVAAQRLLREREARIADIAAATGFCDQSHFSRVFKSVEGVTPREWRRREA